ncbi:uncharacterized protein LOC131330513 [Rhododendron vialii]|uniref:uncharacterized protein LOC131330513 n=1 Tax=Rhododendron vialii TaxID=182163 RepID=UPI00265DD567|nr:uncharacterized protein LOC131330513 [Rhododendron vialii]
MSRCFPYPPPGYYPKGERSEAALIEPSIKLQKEREKAETERKKERKREKKEKKRESKVKDASASGHGEKRKRKQKDEKAHKGEKDTADMVGKHIQKRGEDEAEQLERSNLTEEHEQPVSLQNPCYSSDSTENSNKRRRQTSHVNEIRCTQGNILRIRLPSLKLKESEASVNEEKLYSSSKPVRLPSLKLKEPDAAVTGEKLYSLSKPVRLPSLKLKEPDASVNEGKLYSSSKPIQEELRGKGTDLCRGDEEQICSTSGGTGNSAQDKLWTAKGSTSKKGIPTVESLFKDLVENWVSPPLQSERTDLDELDWLFGRKHPVRERVKASNDVSCIGSANLLPRAHYLPEVDIYALPFTIPF